MDKIIHRPLGLAILITATVSLLAQPSANQVAANNRLPQVPAGNGLEQGREPRSLPKLPQESLPFPPDGSPNSALAQAPLAEPSSQELLTARLVLSVESLFQATTPN